MRIALCSGLSSEFDRDVKISDGCLSERFSTCSVEPSSECLRNRQCTLKNTFFNKIVIFFFLFERKHWILCSDSGLSQKGFFFSIFTHTGWGFAQEALLKRDSHPKRWNLHWSIDSIYSKNQIPTCRTCNLHISEAALLRHLNRLTHAYQQNPVGKYD